jgi:hypothetical protein
MRVVIGESGGLSVVNFNQEPTAGFFFRDIEREELRVLGRNPGNAICEFQSLGRKLSFGCSFRQGPVIAVA